MGLSLKCNRIVCRAMLNESQTAPMLPEPQSACDGSNPPCVPMERCQPINLSMHSQPHNFINWEREALLPSHKRLQECSDDEL